MNFLYLTESQRKYSIRLEHRRPFSKPIESTKSNDVPIKAQKKSKQH